MPSESTNFGSAPSAGPARPRLLDQVHDAIRRRFFSRRTEEAYVHWIKRFIYFTGKRHPIQDNPREGVRARGREMDKDGT